MARTLCLTILLGMLAFPARADEPEKYTIQFRRGARGDSTLVVKEENAETKTVIKTEEQVIQTMENKSGEAFKFREEILEKIAGKRATRVARTYEKAETIRDGKTRALSIQGKKVLIEKKDGKLRFTYADGKELSKEDATVMEKEFTRQKEEADELDQLLLPKKPVAVGQTWKLEMSPLLKLMSQDEKKLVFDSAKAAGTGKLVRAYKKDGSQFGVMEFSLDMPIKQMGEGKSRIDFKMGTQLVLTMSIDACIDGSSPAGTVKHKVQLTGTGNVSTSPQIAVLVSALNTGMESRELNSKK